MDTPQNNLVAPIAILAEKNISMRIEDAEFPLRVIEQFAATPQAAREKLLAFLPRFVQAAEEVGVDVPFVLSCAGLLVVFLPQPHGKVIAERAKNGADANFLIAEWEATNAPTDATEGGRDNG